MRLTPRGRRVTRAYPLLLAVVAVLWLEGLPLYIAGAVWLHAHL